MLAVKGLVAGYGNRPVASLASLVVGAGDACVLAGPSGTGKTTLLLAIAGLAERMAGDIAIGDIAVANLGPRARDRHRGRHIGLIFQDLHLVPGLSALDNMLLAPFAAGIERDRDRALGLLDRLDLTASAHKRAETLSRGQAQRVAIARTMLVETQLVLADEPTASLDDEACSAVLDLLFETTRESGAALIIATHDSRVKARIDHIAMVEAA